MHWEYLIFGLIAVFGIYTILFGKLKIHPPHTGDSSDKENKTKDKPSV